MRTLPASTISLIHFEELNKAGWWDEASERYIFAVLWDLNQPAPKQQIKKEIFRNFYVDYKGQELDRLLNLLERRGEIKRSADGRYQLSFSKKDDLEKRIQASRDLENSAKIKFANCLKEFCPEVEVDNAWAIFLDHFIVPLVASEGARAYDLLTGTRKTSSSSYIDEFLRHISPISQDGVRQAVYKFLSFEDHQVQKYLLSYLDAYFMISASGLPEDVLYELTGRGETKLEFVIFVDTNFVYSILNLHDNPSNEAANDLQELVSTLSNHISIKFVIKQSTFEETQSSIKYHRSKLSSSYPPNVAEAATSMEISGVFKTFFERVYASGQRISAQEYFKPYEQGLLQMLEEKGITLFAETKSEEYVMDLEAIEDIDAQLQFERERYVDNAKSEDQITHDVLLWHFIQGERGKHTVLPLRSKYWVVTVDYRFLAFDKYKSSRRGVLPVCMHPSQLIQVLRFFVPRSPQLEKILLSVMKFPLVVSEFNSKSEQITIKILNHVSRHEGIEDVPVSTLTSVIADATLRERLQKQVYTEQQEIEVIQSALAKALADRDQKIKEKDSLLSEKESQLSEKDTHLQQKEQEIHAYRNRIIELDNRLSVIEADKIKQDEKITKADEKIVKLNQNLDEITKERNNYKLTLRIIIALLIAVSGVFIIFFLPILTSWNWLLGHAHKLGLQLCLLYTVLGICWIIVDTDNKRKWFIVSSILIACLIALTQII